MLEEWTEKKKAKTSVPGQMVGHPVSSLPNRVSILEDTDVKTPKLCLPTKTNEIDGGV